MNSVRRLLPIGERSIGAQVQPRVRGQTENVALGAERVSRGVGVDVAADRKVRTVSPSRRDAGAARPSIRHIRIHGVALVVIGEEVFGRLSGAAGVLELGLVPRVRQPSVEAVRRSPFELELDAVGVAVQGVLPVRRLRQDDAVVLDANLPVFETQQVAIATVVHRSRHAQRRADLLLEAHFDRSPTARAPAACLPGQTACDRSSAPGAARRRQIVPASRNELRTRRGATARPCFVRSDPSVRIALQA